MEEVHKKREAERASRTEEGGDKGDAVHSVISRPTGQVPSGLPPGYFILHVKLYITRRTF